MITTIPHHRRLTFLLIAALLALAGLAQRAPAVERPHTGPLAFDSPPAPSIESTWST